MERNMRHWMIEEPRVNSSCGFMRIKVYEKNALVLYPLDDFHFSVSTLN
jgi:hypothetical protein